MDLQQLHECSGIELRKLRYCLDHKLIPGLHIKSTRGEAGQPRKFADDVGFGIVCAAQLLELGLPHARIRGFLEGLLRIRIRGQGPEKLVLVAVLEQRTPAIAQLGDGVNVRIIVEEHDYDTGWIPPNNSARLADDYRPIVIVALDIGQIRDQVFNRR
jgi:hypothetical protein